MAVACLLFFFFKQKTAYEMCGRDWSSDVCSSDLYSDTYTSILMYALKIRHAMASTHINIIAHDLLPSSPCTPLG